MRTDDWLLIRNFAPDRYPMGVGPGAGLPETTNLLPAEVWEHQTFAGYADLDASPTKAEITLLRNLGSMRPFFDIAYGRRPAIELYDLNADPHQQTNLADRTETTEVQSRLMTQLMDELKRTDDPRLVDNGRFYEEGEMAAESESGRRSRARTKANVQKQFDRELQLP